MRIGIIGCGIAGLTAAIALARAGHRITILERFAKPRALGAGLLLQPSGLAALDRLGLGDRVRKAGAKVESLDGRTIKNQPVLMLDYKDWQTGAHGIGIHRAMLFAILYAEARATGATIVTDAEIIDIKNPDAPSVTDTKGRTHGAFDLLIVADGTASQLRSMISPTSRAPVYPWGALWAAIPNSDERWQGKLTQRYRGASMMMGVLPIGKAPDTADQQHVAFFWSIRHDELDQWRADGMKAFKAHVRTLWPDAADLLEPIDDPNTFNHATYRNVAARPSINGRTLLIGDAAHGTSPQLGQGANLAIIDALELTFSLQQHTDSVDAALKDYHKRRKNHIRWFQTLSAALTPVFQSRSQLIGFSRDMFLAPLCKTPFIRQLMLNTLCGVARPPERPWCPPDTHNIASGHPGQHHRRQ